MSHYLQSGSTFMVLADEDITIHDKLPPRTYRVTFNEMKGQFFLEPISDFNLPKKIYGDSQSKASRIIKTFDNRPNTTGVHLSGVKGSGKTMLSKLVSREAALRGWPTIVVNQPFGGDGFNQFIQSIQQPAVVIFDEFEKVYDWQNQNKLLTLLDGVYPTKKLFMLTSNESSSVSQYLRNRPGRIYYSFNFDTLDPVFVEEFAADNLLDQSQVANLVNFAKVFSFFNFDMMAAAIEEMNRYGEPLDEVLKFLNIQPELHSAESYTMTLRILGREIVVNRNFTGFEPLHFDEWIDVKERLENGDAPAKPKKRKANAKSVSSAEAAAEFDISELFDDIAQAKTLYDDEGYINFKAHMLTGFDANTGTYTYTAGQGPVKAELVVAKNAPQLGLGVKDMMTMGAW